jgi:hypothetical protein
MSFDTEPSFDPEVSGPKGRTKCRIEDQRRDQNDKCVFLGITIQFLCGKENGGEVLSEF